MDSAAYHVVYVDKRVTRDLDGRLLQKSGSSQLQGSSVHIEDSCEDRSPDCVKSILGEVEEVRDNLRSILSVFNGGTYYGC